MAIGGNHPSLGPPGRRGTVLKTDGRHHFISGRAEGFLHPSGSGALGYGRAIPRCRDCLLASGMCSSPSSSGTPRGLRDPTVQPPHFEVNSGKSELRSSEGENASSRPRCRCCPRKPARESRRRPSAGLCTDDEKNQQFAHCRLRNRSQARAIRSHQQRDLLLDQRSPSHRRQR